MSSTETPVRDPGPLTPPAPERATETPDTSGDGRLVAASRGVDAARGLALLGMMADHALYVSDARGDPTWVGRVVRQRCGAVRGARRRGRRVHDRSRPGRGARGSARRRPCSRGPRDRADRAGRRRGHRRRIAAVILALLRGAVRARRAAGPAAHTRARGPAVLGAGGLPVLSQLARAHLPAPRSDNPSLRWLPRGPVGLGRELLITGLYPRCRGCRTWRRPRARARAAALAEARRRARGGGAALAAAATGVSALLLGPGGGLAAARRDVRRGRARPGHLQRAPRRRRRRHHADLHVVVARVDAPHSSTPLDLARTTGIALAVIGVMLCPRRRAASSLRPPRPCVRAPLAAAGAMTLTFYTLHVLFLSSPGRRLRPRDRLRHPGRHRAPARARLAGHRGAWTPGDARLRRRHPRRPPGRRLTGEDEGPPPPAVGYPHCPGAAAARRS